MILLKFNVGTYRVYTREGHLIGRIELYDEKYVFEPFAGWFNQEELLSLWSVIKRLNDGERLQGGEYKGPGLANALTLK